MNKVYTGIGSRDIPDNKMQQLEFLAIILEKMGYCVRTGDAIGSDFCFRNKIKHCQVYTVNDADKFCREIAKRIHPNWNSMKKYSQDLHARNCKQVLGDKLIEPSMFLLCYTKNGEIKGGSRTAIILAQENNIPVFNIYFDKDIINFIEFIKKDPASTQFNDIFQKIILKLDCKKD